MLHSLLRPNHTGAVEKQLSPTVVTMHGHTRGLKPEPHASLALPPNPAALMRTPSSACTSNSKIPAEP
jgi:hypothetical protein